MKKSQIGVLDKGCILHVRGVNKDGRSFYEGYAKVVRTCTPLIEVVFRDEENDRWEPEPAVYRPHGRVYFTSSECDMDVIQKNLTKGIV